MTTGNNSEPSTRFQTTRKIDLTIGSIQSHLIRMTIPMIWGILTMISFQLVNTYYISKLGTKALAAITFTFPLTYMLFCIFLGFSIAMSSVVSRLIGKGDSEDVRRTATQGIFLAFIVSIILSISGIIFHKPLFRILGADESLTPLISDYMLIYFSGITFISLPIVCNAALRATGDAKTQAIIMTCAAIINAAIDPVLIYGLWGAPRLELQGAAISTVIANSCAMLASLFILNKKQVTALHYLTNLQHFRDTMKSILSIAIPAGLTSSLPSIVNSVIIHYLSRSGDPAVAAFGVVTRIEAFAFTVMMALAVGMAPIIGQNYGAKKFERVQETISIALKFSIIWSLITAAILGIFAPQLSKIFATDIDVIKIITLYFWIVPISYPLGNIISGWGSAFNATGHPKISATILFIKSIIILCPAIYIGYKIAGTTGIFTAICLTNITTGIFFHHFSQKKIIRLMDYADQINTKPPYQ